MADGPPKKKQKIADGASSQQNKLTEMTVEDYLNFRMLNVKLNTGTDRDNQMESLAAMIEDLQSNDLEKQLDASYNFRRILEIGPNPPFKQVVDAGVVPHFVQFLDRHDFPQLQYEACYILCLFAENFEDIVDLVLLDMDVLHKLVMLLHAPSECTYALAFSTVAKMAWKSEVLRIAFRGYAMEPLLTQLRKKHKSPYTPERAADALYSLCMGETPLNSEMSAQVLPVIQDLLSPSNKRIMVFACLTLQCLPHGVISDARADLHPGVCSKLLDMLDHNSVDIIHPVIDTVASILKGAEILAKYLVNLRTIRRLETLLSGAYGNDIKKAACQTVTYITKKSCNHTQEVVSEGIINVLANLFTSAEDDMKKEVAWAMSNVTCNGTPQDVRSVSEACIKPLCDMLDSPDQELVFNCIRGLHRILDTWQQELTDGMSYVQKIEDVEGLQKIVKLRDRGQVPVSGIAQSVLQTYWPGKAF